MHEETTLKRNHVQRSLVLADWDGTLRRGFTLQAWSSYLVKCALIPATCVVRLESLFEKHAEGGMSHDHLASKTASVYAASLGGVDVASIRSAAQRFVEDDRPCLFSKALQILSALREGGAEVIISGAPVEVLEAYGTELALYEIYWLEVAVERGRYRGTVRANPGISRVKARLVKRLTEQRGVRVIAALGNSPSDLPLFHAAPVRTIVDDLYLDPGPSTYCLADGTDVTPIIDAVRREAGRSG